LTAGNSVPDQIIPILIHLISATTSLHEYTVSRLFESILIDVTNQPLNQVASWCIGEYADVLINKGRTPDDIIGALNKLVKSHLSSKSTKSYAINAMAKLTNRVNHESLITIQSQVKEYGSSMILELQQRSVEFSALFNKVNIDYDS
jgi:AP-1 complex subunit gamma-1